MGGVRWKAWYRCSNCQKEYTSINLEPNFPRECDASNCSTFNSPYAEVRIHYSEK